MSPRASGRVLVRSFCVRACVRARFRYIYIYMYYSIRRKEDEKKKGKVEKSA
jgi:hypothetical protein